MIQAEFAHCMKDKLFCVECIYCKNKLAVVTTDWLPWLQLSRGDSDYERFTLVQTSCIRQPETLIHNQLT